ncbi:hypothetical protein KIPB_007933 [Kipferlia bialata]|uniref:FAD/NAD(P)-binding domain-containing protein n=1 Tax=Kipferlia bialata TaxID=797122 RepID=A0A9K3D1P6_9EUKA|nr:hypothetical protein KIPB_007933 [Kipferlia bialata]|eukprot:g7933.t1
MLGQKDGAIAQLTGGIQHLFDKYGVERVQGEASFLDQHSLSIAAKDGKDSLETQQVLIATGSKASQLPFVHTDKRDIVTSTEALSFEEVPEHLIVVGAGVIGLELGSVWARLGSKVTVVEYQDRILPGTDAECARVMQRELKKQGLSFKTGQGVDAITALPGLENVNITPNQWGQIEVDPVTFGTDVQGMGHSSIHAIGDVIKGEMLAHKAEVPRI